MFDLITGKTRHMPSGGPVTVLLSSVLHLTVLGVILLVPMLFVANILPPAAPAMMAFVVAPPPPPPPPPPSRVKDTPAKVVTPNVDAFPVDAPSRIAHEPAVDDEETMSSVEGGMTGGVVGGIVGGLEALPPPPPPAPLPTPPPPPPQQPVRIGGDVHPPTLLRRVEPIYPEMALRARVEGTVILEAILDEEGTVHSLKVLRSVPLLNQAAIAAVEQWHYSPVTVNGTPVQAILTVLVTFKIPAI